MPGLPTSVGIISTACRVIISGISSRIATKFAGIIVLDGSLHALCLILGIADRGKRCTQWSRDFCVSLCVRDDDDDDDGKRSRDCRSLAISA